MMQLRADEQRAAETADTTLKPSLDPHGYFTSAQLLELDPASARSRAVLWPPAEGEKSHPRQHS